MKKRINSFALFVFSLTSIFVFNTNAVAQDSREPSSQNFPAESASAPTEDACCVVKRHRFDFDGDGTSDRGVISWNLFDNIRYWYVISSPHNVPLATGVAWGYWSDKIAPGDYDGDKKTDFAIYREGFSGNNNRFFVWQSSTNTVAQDDVFGIIGDVPVGGDWDGDGKDDRAVYRPGSDSYFFYRASSTGVVHQIQ